jgi:hypothetical protein
MLCTVGHILDALPVTTGIKSPRPEPEPWAGQTLGAQVLGEAQFRNAKEVFWDVVPVDQHCTAIIRRSRPANQRPTRPCS